MSQLRCTIDKAIGYGYKNIGFILDRGYFSKENIDYMDKNGLSFLMMLKGKADLVRKWIQEKQGNFETKRSCNIPAYQTYGTTIETKLFESDRKPVYVHLYHSSDLESKERSDVEKKINQLTTFLKSHINQDKEFGKGIETYFNLHYIEETSKKKNGEEKKTRKFVFFEEKTDVIELELKMCGYFVLITSDKMTAKEALELYKGRDISEKLFLADKTFLGNRAVRNSTEESAASKVFIEFIALIIRNRMYNCLKDELKEMPDKPNYMTVPAAIRELDKIEMSRHLNGVYRLDHAVTAKQKTILKAFGMTEANIKAKAKEISRGLACGK